MFPLLLLATAYSKAHDAINAAAITVIFFILLLLLVNINLVAITVPKIYNWLIFFLLSSYLGLNRANLQHKKAGLILIARLLLIGVLYVIIYLFYCAGGI